MATNRVSAFVVGCALGACVSPNATAKSHAPHDTDVTVPPQETETLIWRLKDHQSLRAEGIQHSGRYAELLVSEIRSSGTELLLDVQNRDFDAVGANERVAAEVDVTVDGCSHGRVSANGVVEKSALRPDTLSIPLGELPDGDLERISQMPQEDNEASQVHEA